MCGESFLWTSLRWLFNLKLNFISNFSVYWMLQNKLYIRYIWYLLLQLSLTYIARNICKVAVEVFYLHDLLVAKISAFLRLGLECPMFCFLEFFELCHWWCFCFLEDLASFYSSWMLAVAALKKLLKLLVYMEHIPLDCIGSVQLYGRISSILLMCFSVASLSASFLSKLHVLFVFSSIPFYL